MMAGYREIIRQAAPYSDPKEVEEQIRAQIGGTLDHLTREELIEEAVSASEILRGLA